MKQDNSTTIKSMRLSSGAIQTVQKLAQQENRNFSNMVETIILRAGTGNEDRSNKKK